MSRRKMNEKKRIILMRSYGASWKKISKVCKVSIQKAAGVWYAWQRMVIRSGKP
jgi:hypothetical protein